MSSRNEHRVMSDEEIRARRQKRVEEAKRRKRKKAMLFRYGSFAAPVLVGAIIMVAILLAGRGKQQTSDDSAGKSRISGDAATQIAGLGEQKGSSQGTGNNVNTGIASIAAGENNEITEAAGKFAIADDAAEWTGRATVPETGQNQGQGSLTGRIDENRNAGNGETIAAYNNEKVYEASATAVTANPGDSIVSTNAIFLNMDNAQILSQKDAKVRISPASMTKILTVLAAAEHVEEAKLDDTFTITLEVTDYGYRNDCSTAGFERDETVTVRDLFYGTILPSGADAAVGLAMYVSGSQEAFVELMNEKLSELGLAGSAHMTNCVGIYDEEHYCTVYDMAMILEAALDNPLCREVLSAHTYNTSATAQHPEGLLLSNWFLRRIEDKDTGGEVICAKTGFVVQSGNCAASFGKDAAGNQYICVTAGATSTWRCIYDHVALYKQYAQGISEAD